MAIIFKKLRNVLLPLFVLGTFFFLMASDISAGQPTEWDADGQEASASEAQATMASLFGRGGKMPGIPRISGTIALPSFDSSGMMIDEGALNLAEQQSPADDKNPRPETLD